MSPEFPHIFSVSQLTKMIKNHLEGEFALVWVRGEISNLRYPQSGHCYFTLKDQASQIRVVIFRSALQGLRLRPAEAVQIICRGQLTVYEPRGEYQLIVDYLEPLGAGALAQAFEELKNRLAAEGLFDARHKKPIPYLPRRLGVVTSPSGAAIRDFLQVLHRRFPNIEVYIYPVRVQGPGAGAEIAAAVQALNTWPDLDVIILTRGGGSLEDLWAFNEEIVARAIYASTVPVISAVGHEIDVTIADFVADLRAPTPSAAAELVVRRQEELQLQLRRLAVAMQRRFLILRQQCQERLRLLAARLSDPRRRVADLRLRLDDRFERLLRLWHNRRRESGAQLKLAKARLNLRHIRRQSEQQRHFVERHKENLQRLLTWRLQEWRRRLDHYQTRVEHLDPGAILARGYAIATALPEGVILRDARQAPVASDILVYLHQGALECRVTRQCPERTCRSIDHV